MSEHIWLTPPEAYEHLKSSRIDELELVAGGVYTALFNLKNEDRFCLRFNTRLDEWGVVDNLIGFNVVDLDLEPKDLHIEANIYSGIINFTGVRPRYWSSTEVATGNFVAGQMDEGFLLDYRENVDMDAYQAGMEKGVEFHHV